MNWLRRSPLAAIAAMAGISMLARVVIGPLVGLETSMTSVVIGTLLGGAFMVAYARGKARTSGITFSATQDTTFLVGGAARDVAVRSVEVLRSIGAQRISADPATRTIRGRTGIRRDSWGEVVTLTVHAAEGGVCRVHVRSDPRFRAALMDWGANERNVRLVQERLAATGPLPTTSLRSAQPPIALWAAIGSLVLLVLVVAVNSYPH